MDQDEKLLQILQEYTARLRDYCRPGAAIDPMHLNSVLTPAKQLVETARKRISARPESDNSAFEIQFRLAELLSVQDELQTLSFTRAEPIMQSILPLLKEYTAKLQGYPASTSLQTLLPAAKKLAQFVSQRLRG